MVNRYQANALAVGHKLRFAKKPSATIAYKEACLVCDCNGDQAALLDLKRKGQSLSEFPLPACHCKDFTSILREYNAYKDLSSRAKDEDKHIIYTMATRECVCGSGIKVCRSVDHIQALRGIIALYEQRRDFTEALKAASLLLLVAPYAPEGYLLMAKILGLKEGDGTKVKRQRSWIFSQASSSVQVYGGKTGYNLIDRSKRTIKFDPLQGLPLEIQQLILSYISTSRLCELMTVSKQWQQICCTPGLWMRLEFASSKPKPFRRNVLNKIISHWSQNSATSLTISGLKDYRISATLLRSVLKALPQLQSLTLGNKGRAQNNGRSEDVTFQQVLTMLHELAPAHLRVLSLYSLKYKVLPEGPFSGTPSFAQKLEELSLDGILGVDADSFISDTFTYPNLTKLLINGLCTKEKYPEIPRRDFSVSLDLPTLRNATPVLKDLELAHIRNIIPADNDQQADLVWDTVERLFLHGVAPCHLLGMCSSKLQIYNVISAKSEGEFAAWGAVSKKLEQSADTQLLAPVYDGCSTLKHLCFIFERETPPDVPEYDAALEDGDPRWTENHSLFGQIVPSLRADTVQSITMSFDPYAFVDLWQAYGKDSGKSLRTLILVDIRASIPFQSWTDEGDYLERQVLPRFPNLHTLGLFSEFVAVDENLWRVVLEVMDMFDNIRHIRTNLLRGVGRDEVLEVARELGVVIQEECQPSEYRLKLT